MRFFGSVDPCVLAVPEPLTCAAIRFHCLPGHTRKPQSGIPGRTPPTPGMPCRFCRDALPLRQDPPGGYLLPQFIFPRRVKEWS